MQLSFRILTILSGPGRYVAPYLLNLPRWDHQGTKARSGQYLSFRDLETHVLPHFAYAKFQDFLIQIYSC